MTGDSLVTIFRRVIEESQGDLTPAQAEAVLRFRFTEADEARVAELGRKSNAGSLTPGELAEYEAYADAADLLSLWQAQARLALRHRASTSAA